VLVRATLANPVARKSPSNARELIDGTVVTVMLEGAEPQMVVAVPSNALMADQQGLYVLVVDKDSRAQVRRVKTGQGMTDVTAIESGLEAGESVIVEGAQRVRPGQPVTPTLVEPLARQERMPK
jgi:membrane fusion protein (multidrug efflux system)